MPASSAVGRVLSGVAKLLGDVHGGVPAAVPEVDEYKADGELPGKTARGCSLGHVTSVSPISRPHREAEEQKGREYNKLQSGESVLHARDVLDAKDIEQREDSHQRAGKELATTEIDRDRP